MTNNAILAISPVNNDSPITEALALWKPVLSNTNNLKAIISIQPTQNTKISE